MYESLKEDFKKVISYSQKILSPEVDELFDLWQKNKQSFISLFGDKLIYEFPQVVSFQLDEESKNKKFKDFVDTVKNRWNNQSLGTFLEYMKNGFFSNKVTSEYCSPQGEVIPKGMKIVKAFKYFETDHRALRELQDYASQIIQENCISGKLCFSVHPLDYLSISENAFNWRSCHALDGDYRAGNLNYMADNCSIVVYLKSKEDTYLPNFPADVKWNSKKWRVLLFFSQDENMLMAGRQYPFVSYEGIEQVRRILNKLCPQYISWSKWHNYMCKSLRDITNNEEFLDVGENSFFFGNYLIPVGQSLMRLDRLVRNKPYTNQFNDLLYSHCYKPIYSYRSFGMVTELGDISSTGRSDEASTRFFIGEPVKCLECGENYIYRQTTMMCSTCADKHMEEYDEYNFRYCYLCDRYFDSEQGQFYNGEYYCPRCAQETLDYCEKCGQLTLKTNLTYNRIFKMFMCENCNKEK